MISREVTPCIECGGDPTELDELREQNHSFARVGYLAGEILCDFCDADMPSTDPLAWGFPKGFDWTKTQNEGSYEDLGRNLYSQKEIACPKCYTTMREQSFVINNAKRNEVRLPSEYWGHLSKS